MSTILLHYYCRGLCNFYLSVSLFVLVDIFLKPADQVDDTVGGGIPHHPVDGEVAPADVGLEVREGDGIGVAAVGIGTLRAVGGHLDARVALHDDDDAEGLADGDVAGEKSMGPSVQTPDQSGPR